jgi:formylglycine-generating enzyme required for sulfatase activity
MRSLVAVLAERVQSGSETDGRLRVEESTVAKHRLCRWLQFGILDLLILTAVVAVVLVLWRPPRIETYYEPLAEGTTPGQPWWGNGLRMKFRWCPPGEFKMGSPKDTKDREDDEDQVPVTLTRGFWLGKCEVTQGEYRQVMNDSPSGFPREGRDAALAVGVDVDKLPVESASWHDAVEFCRRLTEQERKAGRLPPAWEYRLPTEAQWEYACRAGTQTAYCCCEDGSGLGAFAWYEDNSRNQTHEVGQKLPNAWGLRDLHGNVWEWCGDWYQDPLVGGADPEVNEPASDYRVCRGGGSRGTGRRCRSADRDWYTPNRGSHNVGFRVALVQSQ